MHRYFRDIPESIDQVFREVGHASFPDVVAAEDLSGDVTAIDPTERQADSVLKVRTKEGDEFVLIFMAFIPVDEETLRESPVLNEVVEGLEAKAEARGEAKGLAAGAARSVLALLDDRQIELTDAERERILAVDDHEMLRRWLLAAVHVGGADELFG